MSRWKVKVEWKDPNYIYRDYQVCQKCPYFTTSNNDVGESPSRLIVEEEECEDSLVKWYQERFGMSKWLESFQGTLERREASYSVQTNSISFWFWC